MAASDLLLKGITQYLNTKIKAISDTETTDIVAMDSSAIDTMEYDIVSGELIINFQSGSSYLYHFVPEPVYQDIASASSAGATYVHEVRNSIWGLSYTRLS